MSGNQGALQRLQEAVNELRTSQNLPNMLQKALGDNTQILNQICRVTVEALIKSRKQGVKEGQGSRELPRTDISGVSSVLKQFSMQYPKGKWDVAFCKETLVIQNNRQEVAVPYSAIQSVLVFDKMPQSESATKDRLLVALYLKPTPLVYVGKRETRMLIIDTSATSEISLPNPVNNEQILQGLAIMVLCKAFGSVGIHSFEYTSDDIYRSSQGHSCFYTYMKAQRGLLFPMNMGLCFVGTTPQVLSFQDDVASLELSRTSNRMQTFDLIAHLKDGRMIDYSAIDRDQLTSIQSYVAATKLAKWDTQGAQQSSAPPQPSSKDKDKGVINNNNKRPQQFGVSMGGEEDDSDSDDEYNPAAFYATKRRKADEGSSQNPDPPQSPDVLIVTGHHTAQNDEEEASDDDDDEASDDEGSDDDEDEESDEEGSEDVELVDEEDFGITAAHVKAVEIRERKEEKQGGGGQE